MKKLLLSIFFFLSLNLSAQIQTQGCAVNAQFYFTSSGPYITGATISAANISTGATSYRWYLNNSLIGNSLNINYQLNSTGIYAIYLVADNGTCVDTSAVKFISVGNCTLGGWNNHWYVDNHSIDFSNSPPTFGTSPIHTIGRDFWGTSVYGRESSAAISDANGNLLFFTDGDTIWDRTGTIMPNGTGLMGHVSSMQVALAVPFPGHPNQYYLFTKSTDNGGVFDDSTQTAAHYSIIDMSLNNGMGDVIVKNVLIRKFLSEALTGTFHANGQDMWIVYTNCANTDVYAYRLTADGIQPPVVTNMGIYFGTAHPAKFSNDGNRFAVACWDTIVVADFDRQTGKFSNLHNIVNPRPNGSVRALEFSPDDSKLYAGFGGSLTYRGIYQYNLNLPSDAAIIASAIKVSARPEYWWQLALGNDGKIYVGTVSGSTVFDHIDFPNTLGTACGYTQQDAPSNFLAFPNFIKSSNISYIPSIYGKNTFCGLGQLYTYSIPFISGNDSVDWIYSGPGHFTNNGDNTASVVTDSTAGGQGVLIATIHGRCGTTYDTLLIDMHLPQVNILGNDTLLCNATSLQLTADGEYDTYNWSTGDTTPSITVLQTGLYGLIATNGCYSSTDSINVSIGFPPFQLMHNGDTVACKNVLPFTLDAPAGYTQYSWQDGNTAQSYAVGTIGSYWVTVTDGAGCTSVDTFKVLDCTGIDEEFANGIRIYPTPVSNTLYIETLTAGAKQVKLFNAAGQMVHSVQFTGKTELPMQHLPNGLYIAEVVGGNSIVRKKVLVMD